MNWYDYLERGIDNNKSFREWLGSGDYDELTNAVAMLDNGLWHYQRNMTYQHSTMIDYIYTLRCAEYERKNEEVINGK